MAHPTSTSPQLTDRWDARGSVPLDGVLERERFPPLLMALVVPVAGLVLFNFVIFPLAIVPLLAVRGIPLAQPQEVMQSLFQEHTGLLLVGNSIGEALGLALPAVLVARWHSSRWPAFMRLRRGDARLWGMAVLGWVTLYPVVSWLGTINQMIPLPDVLQQFEQEQMALIEKVLMSNQGIFFSLLVLAVTPALCEELLFRGYVLRQGERSLGTVGGILFSGVAFGLFHLRFSQALPLVALGCYLAYLVWRTGSLWPAVLVHFANNAFAVGMGVYADAQADLTSEEVQNMQMPWYLVFGAVVLLSGVLFVLHRWAPRLRHHELDSV